MSAPAASCSPPARRDLLALALAADPATEQHVLVWSERPKRVLILKKLGKALLPYLVEVAQLLRAQGCRVLVEERVLQEIEEEGGEQSFGLAGALQALPTERRHDALVVPDGAGIDCVVALGGDGVILADLLAVRGAVPQ